MYDPTYIKCFKNANYSNRKQLLPVDRGEGNTEMDYIETQRI